jgi:putative FmdB family regulatory protein
MPIYEYRCKDCRELNEFLVGVVQDKIEIKCSIVEVEV